MLSDLLIWFLDTETMVHVSLLNSLGSFYLNSIFHYFSNKYNSEYISNPIAKSADVYKVMYVT